LLLLLLLLLLLRLLLDSPVSGSAWDSSTLDVIAVGLLPMK
jgi:hypothetical protein